MHPGHGPPAGLRKFTAFIMATERFGLFLFSRAHD